MAFMASCSSRNVGLVLSELQELGERAPDGCHPDGVGVERASDGVHALEHAAHPGLGRAELVPTPEL